MNTLAQQPDSRGERGSVLIMVVVVVVIMALMGATYLQVVRVQRISIADSQSAAHIDDVAASALGIISARLQDDLVKDGTNDDNFEFYDFPWTNFDCATRQVDTFYQSNLTVNGGEGDDQWLAATSPDFNNESHDGRWSHISNIMGYFIGASGGKADLTEISEVDSNNEFAVTSANLNGSGSDANTDSNIPTGSNMLVDADGDGIGDSRWTWAPYPIADGKIYTMAVRVVDLSSMVNINTSPFHVNNDDPTTIPLWDNPASFWPAKNLVGSDERVMVSRLDRTEDWNKIGRYDPFSGDPEGSSSRSTLYTLTDEYELRHRNGLNNENVIAPIEDAYPDMLRRDATGETNYDARDITTHPSMSASNIAHFFNFNQVSGGRSSTALGLGERRKFLTTMSGTNVLAAPLPNEAFDPDFQSDFSPTEVGSGIQIDLNYASTKMIAERIRAVYADFDRGKTPGSIGISGEKGWNGGWDHVHHFSEAFTACIVDYGDRKTENTSGIDNAPDEEVEVTKVGDWFGFEYVPFITEVYVQRLYKVKSAAETSNENEYNVVWESESGTKPGFAIEISNPYHVPIPVKGVSLWVNNNRITNGIDKADLYDLAGSELESANAGLGSPRSSFLKPGQKLILYKNSENGTADDITALIDSTDAVLVELADQDLSNRFYVQSGFQKNVTVDLRANVFNQEETSFPYSRVNMYNLPNTITDNGYVADPDNPATIPVPQTTLDYYQISTQGGDDGLVMMTIREGDAHMADQLPKAGSLLKTDMDRLGDGSKLTTNQPSVPANSQILVSNHFSGRILQPGELALVSILAWGGRGNNNQKRTIPDRVRAASGSSFDLDKFRIDLTEPEVIDVNKPNYNVPHAVYLIDQFTTLHPGYDEIDNDNADNDNNRSTGTNDEIYVPGRINLNTIPESDLRLALPLDSQDARSDIAAAIAKFRQNPRRGHGSSYGDADNSSVKGIAWIGELFEQDLTKTLDQLYHPNGHEGIDTVGIDDTGSFDLWNDFIANPVDGNGAVKNDEFIDDIEETTLVARWLSAAATTRSDTYIAYVLVQGWKVDDFSAGPTESKRYMAILRRTVDDEGVVRVKALLPGGQVYTVE